MKKLLLLLLPFVLLFAACSKETSFEASSTTATGTTAVGIATGTAKYSLTGAGSTCIGAVVSGTYQAGTALVASDTVQLQISVDTIGTYTISTNTTNGFLFSATGTFTQKGLQTITLTGSGTPVGAANITFTPPVGVGCSFVVTVTAAANTAGAGSITSGYTWQFTAYGKTYSGPMLAPKDSLYGSNGINGEIFSMTGAAKVGGLDSGVLTILISNVTGSISTGNYPTNVAIASVGTTVTKVAQFSYGFAEEIGNTGNYDSAYIASPGFGTTLNINISTYNSSTNVIQGSFSGTAQDINNNFLNISNGSFTSKIH